MNRDPKTLKLYIAVLDEVPDHMVPVLVAHSVLNADKRFSHLHWCDDEHGDGQTSYSLWPTYTDWKFNSFKKVVLRVNRKEFNKISELYGVYLGFENSVLDGSNTCAVVCPQYDLPNVLSFAKMWKPNKE